MKRGFASVKERHQERFQRPQLRLFVPSGIFFSGHNPALDARSQNGADPLDSPPISRRSHNMLAQLLTEN